MWAPRNAPSPPFFTSADPIGIPPSPNPRRASSRAAWMKVSGSAIPREYHFTRRPLQKHPHSHLRKTDKQAHRHRHFGAAAFLPPRASGGHSPATANDYSTFCSGDCVAFI
jgi:hypothetical protein